jgi:hypothetical protein
MSNRSNKRPNVIVFFTDQQRWDTTGVHGNPLGLTPNFDRAAAFGTHVYHSFTCPAGLRHCAILSANRLICHDIGMLSKCGSFTYGRPNAGIRV